MPWVFLGCPASLTYLPQMTSLPPVSPLTQVMDVVACVLCESDMCVRCWACEKTSDEEVCNCLIIRQHDVKEDPYLAPEEKKRRLTNLEAMAETRRQQLLDNCVETIDLTTANYQPTFRTASSNPNKRTAPSASTPAVCFSPTRSVGRGRSLGPKRRKPAFSRTHHRVPQVPGCTRWCIGRELHADGGLHFHVFAERRSRFDTENPRYFDIGPFHPNIASVKKLPGLLEYICKDGRYVLGGGLRLFERAATSGIDAPTSMLDKLQPTAVSP